MLPVARGTPGPRYAIDWRYERDVTGIDRHAPGLGAVGALSAAALGGLAGLWSNKRLKLEPPVRNYPLRRQRFMRYTRYRRQFGARRRYAARRTYRRRYRR